MISLASKGAVHEEVFGFERPRWFARGDMPAKDQYSFRRNAVHDMVAHEVKAVREAVGIMDVTAFTKVKVSGAGASDLLEQLTANKLPVKIGGIGLTHMLNRRGRIELETTIMKMDEDCYYLVCAAFFEQRLLDHLNQHRITFEDVTIKSLSADWSALSLNGPRSRDVLRAVTDAPLDNDHFRWLTAQQIMIAGHNIWAMRMSYAGELGWELHMPNDACQDVYSAIYAAGEAYGITDYGSFADECDANGERALKGQVSLTNEVTLPEADVMRFVNTDKDFYGKAASLDIRIICHGCVPIWILNLMALKTAMVVKRFYGMVRLLVQQLRLFMVIRLEEY